MEQFITKMNSGNVCRSYMMQARIVFFLEPRFACEEWIHFHGDQSVIFLPAPLFNRVQLFNETEFCLFRADLPVSVDPFWQSFFIKECKQEVTKVVSLRKNGRQTWKCTHAP